MRTCSFLFRHMDKIYVYEKQTIAIDSTVCLDLYEKKGILSRECETVKPLNAVACEGM